VLEQAAVAGQGDPYQDTRVPALVVLTDNEVQAALKQFRVPIGASRPNCPANLYSHQVMLTPASLLAYRM